MKITEKISVIIIKLIILIVLQFICNQNHMQLMLIINQLLMIITDNAKNNDKLCKHLQKMLKKRILFEIINKKQFVV